MYLQSSEMKDRKDILAEARIARTEASIETITMLKTSRYVWFRKGEGWARWRNAEEEKKDESRHKEDLEIG